MRVCSPTWKKGTQNASRCKKIDKMSEPMRNIHLVSNSLTFETTNKFELNKWDLIFSFFLSRIYLVKPLTRLCCVEQHRGEVASTVGSQLESRTCWEPVGPTAFPSNPMMWRYAYAYMCDVCVSVCVRARVNVRLCACFIFLNSVDPENTESILSSTCYDWHWINKVCRSSTVVSLPTYQQR